MFGLKRNQTEDRVKDKDPIAARKAWLKYFFGFAILSLLAGSVFFDFLPKFLDKLEFVPKNIMGTTPFLAAFLLFINIHHYFIDNTIWRSTNETVKKYLFF